jgi:hypothetical protein
VARTHVPSSHRLADGTFVRIRLPHPGDAPGVAALLERLGVRADALTAGRMLRFDPRTRAVVVACAWTGATETIVGYGTIDLRAGADPDVALADETLAPGLGPLLASVLAGRAEDRARRAA